MTNDFNIIMLSAWHEQMGNTLLRFLDSHPQLLCYPFESQISTPLSSNIIAGPNHFIPQRYCYPEFSSETKAKDAYNLFWDQELKTYLRTPNLSKFKDCGLIMNEQNRMNLFVNCYNDTNNASYRADFIEAFFRSTFYAWENFRWTGKETHYVGYSPPILLEADKFFSDFPFGKMIHIMRNPFSGYADTLKRPFPFSLEKYCQIWNVCQTFADNYAYKYRDKFFFLRAEDLLDSPKFTLDGILSSIGLEKFENIPLPSFNRNPMKQIYPWGTVKNATTEENISTAKSLSTEDVERIYMECYSGINKFGYWPMYAQLTNEKLKSK